MKVIIGADDSSPTFDAVLERLRERGDEVEVVPQADWPTVATRVAEDVASGSSKMGVLMCWTGTGTSMMANRVPGARAALCWDPWIAEGARRWNDANILVMSLKRTSPEDAVRILEAWLQVPGPDADELENIKKLSEYRPGA
jgi:ribose 5-phosphate isomerase B